MNRNSTPLSKLFLLMIMGVFLISNVSALTTGESMIIFSIIFSMMMITIFFLIVSIMSPNTPIKVFFLSLSAIIMVVTVGLGITIIQEFFGDFSSLLVSYGAFYKVMTVLLIGGSLALIVWLVVVSLKSFNAYRGKIDPELPGF